MKTGQMETWIEDRLMNEHMQRCILLRNYYYMTSRCSSWALFGCSVIRTPLFLCRQRTKIPQAMRQGQKEKVSVFANDLSSGPFPLSEIPTEPRTQSLCPTTETTTMSSCSPARKQPPLATTRESPGSNEDPVQPKNK